MVPNICESPTKPWAGCLIYFNIRAEGSIPWPQNAAKLISCLDSDMFWHKHAGLLLVLKRGSQGNRNSFERIHISIYIIYGLVWACRCEVKLQQPTRDRIHLGALPWCHNVECLLIQTPSTSKWASPPSPCSMSYDSIWPYGNCPEASRADELTSWHGQADCKDWECINIRSLC